MAGFHTKTFQLHDDYMTPKSAWEAISHIIPKKKLWEGFYGDGTSGNYLKELGFDVFHEPIDFFTEQPAYWDILVSNPPFSKVKEIVKRLKELNKPFILIIPMSKINTQYIREAFMNDKLQIIIPRKLIQFIKLVNGKPTDQKNACNFDCFYYCWKLDLPNDIVWLQ